MALAMCFVTSTTALGLERNSVGSGSNFFFSSGACEVNRHYVDFSGLQEEEVEIETKL